MPFDYENICTSSLICNKWSITFWCSENNKTMGASTSKRPIMDGRFKMISSNLEGFKFPQLTSVLIASFSLIITIILSPRTWERKQTFTFCLRLHDDLFLSHKSSCMATNVFSQPVTSAQWWNSFPAWITILFPLWCVGTNDWCLPPTVLSLPGSCCLSHGLQLPLIFKCYTLLSNLKWH